MKFVEFTRTHETDHGIDERPAAVNTALVRHVFARTGGGGTYIAFEDGKDGGTPVKEEVETVIRKLNSAYRWDLVTRTGIPILAAFIGGAAVVLVALCGGPPAS